MSRVARTPCTAVSSSLDGLPGRGTTTRHPTLSPRPCCCAAVAPSLGARLLMPQRSQCIQRWMRRLGLLHGGGIKLGWAAWARHHHPASNVEPAALLLCGGSIKLGWAAWARHHHPASNV